jgi:glucose-1-phosphate thymidylyltransferase
VTIVNDGTESNDDRLGAVADIRFVVESRNISTENILIVAGDTLFFRDFSLRQFVEKFNDLQEILPGRSLIVNCPVLGNQLLSGKF